MKPKYKFNGASETYHNYLNEVVAKINDKECRTDIARTRHREPQTLFTSPVVKVTIETENSVYEYIRD